MMVLWSRVTANRCGRVLAVLLGMSVVTAGLATMPVATAAPEPAEGAIMAPAPKEAEGTLPDLKPLFTKEVGEPTTSQPDERVTQAKRVRYVEVDAQEYAIKLRGLPGNIFEGGPPSDKVLGPPPGGPSLVMQLFDGVVVTVPAREIRVTWDGSVAWSGNLERKDQDPTGVGLHFQVATEDKRASVAGSIYQAHGASYEVFTVVGTTVAMVEHDRSRPVIQVDDPILHPEVLSDTPASRPRSGTPRFAG